MMMVLSFCRRMSLFQGSALRGKVSITYVEIVQPRKRIHVYLFMCM